MTRVPMIPFGLEMRANEAPPVCELCEVAARAPVPPACPVAKILLNRFSTAQFHFI